MQVILVALILIGTVLCAQDIYRAIEYPLSVASMSTLAVNSTSQAITPLPGRRFIQVINLSTGTVWINLATTTFTVGTGIPVYALQDWCDILAATAPVGIACSVASNVTVLQGY
jgi:hypothetical protein